MKKIFLIFLLLSTLCYAGCAEINEEDNGIPQAVYYEVTFNSESEELVDAQTVKSGDKAVEPILKVQTKTSINGNIETEYRFVGWYLGESKYDFNVSVTSNITLTAKWEKNGEYIVNKK